MPVAFGSIAVRDLLAFRRSAFGLYSRSAGLMAAGVATGLCYYGVVVLTFALRGDLAGLGSRPFTPVKALLLFQAVLAVGAVNLVRQGGQRMAEITRTHAGEPVPDRP